MKDDKYSKLYKEVYESVKKKLNDDFKNEWESKFMKVPSEEYISKVIEHAFTTHKESRKEANRVVKAAKKADRKKKWNGHKQQFHTFVDKNGNKIYKAATFVGLSLIGIAAGYGIGKASNNN